MSIITAILEPSADGTLHLPVPEEMRHGKIEVIATLRSVPTEGRALRAGSLKDIWIAPDFDAPLEDFKEYS